MNWSLQRCELTSPGHPDSPLKRGFIDVASAELGGGLVHVIPG